MTQPSGTAAIREMLSLLAWCLFGSYCYGSDKTGAEADVAKLERSWNAASPAAQYQYFARATEIASNLFREDRKSSIPAGLALLNHLLEKRECSAEVGDADLIARTKAARFVLDNPIEGDPDSRQSQLNALREFVSQVRRDRLPNYKPAPVYMNLAPRSADGARISGMNPDAISDPKARAEYVALLDENAQNSIRNRRQATLKSMEDEFAAKVGEQISQAGELTARTH